MSNIKQTLNNNEAQLSSATFSIEHLMQQGLAHHRIGKLTDAERFYRIILGVQPNHADANHNLGVLMVQNKQTVAAIPHFKLALESNPNQGQYWLSYIDALIQNGSTYEAGELLKQGRKHGLNGTAVDALAERLVLIAQFPIQSNAVKQKNTKTKHVKKAKRHALLQQNKVPYYEEIDKLITLFAERQYTEAILLAKSLTLRYPHHPFGWKSLGAVYKAMGRNDEALAPMKKSILLLPDDVEAHKNLGNTLKDLGRLEEAQVIYRSALLLEPECEEVHNNLGVILKDLGRLDEAEASYRYALQLKPDLAQVHYNLGVILKDLGRLDEAEASYRCALQLKPDFAQAHYNLGITLHDMKRWGEAVDAYRCSIQLKPDYAQGYLNLGASLIEMKRWDEAEASFIYALNLNSEYAEAYHNLGVIFYEQGMNDKAAKSYYQALAINPNYIESINNLGEFFITNTQFSKAEELFRKCLTIDSSFKLAWSNLLFGYNYHPNKTAEEIYAVYEEYEHKIAAPQRVHWQVHANSRDPSRRLKVGYVSPDFKEHSVSLFLEALLRNHNKNEVEIYAYAELKKEDEVTARYRGYVDHWVATTGMTDESLVECIRKDEIDILLDLAGHTSGNRLGVFALKPAPVSITWLGFGYTTGLKAIDYYLGNKVLLPIGCEPLFSEIPWRLDETSLVYQAKEGMGAVSTLPALGNGYITFGTLTRSVRVNHRTIRVWAQILKRLPTSKLILNSQDYGQKSMQEILSQKFAEYGITPDRLLMGYTTPPWDVLRGIDIGLDCFPHNSGTTLVESLYMGVPYITLAGRPSVGRIGSLPLVSIGHPEWIADNEGAYIDKAVALASDFTKLAEVRSTLRQEMQNSAMMDELGFAHRLEMAYREMWRKWCES